MKNERSGGQTKPDGSYQRGCAPRQTSKTEKPKERRHAPVKCCFPKGIGAAIREKEPQRGQREEQAQTEQPLAPFQTPKDAFEVAFLSFRGDRNGRGSPQCFERRARASSNPLEVRILPEIILDQRFRIPAGIA